MKSIIQPKGKIRLKPQKEKIFLIHHSWIFSGAVQEIIEKEKLENGDWVEVYSDKNHFLGNAFFEKKEQIVARIFDFHSIKIKDFREYWFLKLNSLYERKKNLFDDSNAYRFIHSESDEVPGVICDIYNTFAIIQIDFLNPKELIQLLFDFLNTKEISSVLLKKQKEFQWLSNPIEHIIFKENDILYKINLKEFQKTGFYLDQKINRKKIQIYAKNKKILDTFCYIGSFGINALSKNADIVFFVDSSKKALESIEENIKINNLNKNKIRIIKEDVFSYLEKLESEFFDIIVLDPPAFVKNKKNISSAIKGYIRLNELAMQKINKNGMLFTFSCSQWITKDIFRKIIFYASKNIKRKVSIIEYLTQSIDHTINIFHPEGEYLKGMILYVE